MADSPRTTPQADSLGAMVLGMLVGVVTVFTVLFVVVPDAPDNRLDISALFAAIIAGAFLGKAAS